MQLSVGGWVDAGRGFNLGKAIQDVDYVNHVFVFFSVFIAFLQTDIDVEIERPFMPDCLEQLG